MGEEEVAAWTAGENLGPPGAAVLRDQHEGIDADSGDSTVRRLATELLGALRDAGTAIFEAHKQLAASQTAEVAEAVQRFGRSVDQTESRVINRYCDRAADYVKGAADTMRARSWGEIATDAEDLARRRPALFVLAALGTGFIAGRLLMAAAERERARAAPTPVSVAAAVQSAPAPVAGVR